MADIIHIWSDQATNLRILFSPILEINISQFWAGKNENNLLLVRRILCKNYVQYSVQEACTKCFVVHILKFEILQIPWKKKNIRVLVFSFSSINHFDVSFVFSCGLQYFKSKTQSIWCKLLVLSWLYVYLGQCCFLTQCFKIPDLVW